MLHDPENHGRQAKPRQTGNHGQDRSLAKHLHDDVARLRSDSPADAYLLSPLLDNDPHDIANSYHSGKERRQADEEGKKVDAREERLHLLKHLSNIYRPYSPVVVGIYVVAPIEHGLHPGNQIRKTHPVFGHHHQEVYLVAISIGAPESGGRNYDTLVERSVDMNLRSIADYPYHGIGRPIRIDHLSARLLIAGEQLIGHFLSDNGHFPLPRHIGVVDIPSAIKLRHLHLSIVGLSPDHLAGIRILAILERGIPFLEHRNDGLKLRERFSQDADIREIHLPATSFLISLIRHRGAVGDYAAAIGGKSDEVAFKHILSTASSTQKQSEHRHSPEDSESGHEGARLVAGKRSAYFLPVFYVEYCQFHSFSFIIRRAEPRPVSLSKLSGQGTDPPTPRRQSARASPRRQSPD